MKKSISMLAAVALVAAAGTASAQVFTADFQTNQSANFVVTPFPAATSDNDVRWTYDVTTHVQEGGDPVVIGTAPGGSTTALRFTANLVNEGNLDAVTFYPNVAGLGADWELEADLWINYNGPAAGGSGSTEMFFIGSSNANTVAPNVVLAPSIAGTGFYFTMTGEGGAAADYRFYSGDGNIVANNAGATWLGGANYNNLDDVWDDPTTGFFPAPPYQTAGAPGKQWHTIRLRVVGTTAELYIRRAAVPSDPFNLVATASIPAGAKVAPFFGYGDINATIPATAAQKESQFALIDNLTISNISSVESWMTY